MVSASHYDGAAATAEAALMSCRETRRDRVLVSRGVHPHYRADPRDVLLGGGLELDEIPLVADGPAAGTTDLAALERMLADAERPVAGVIAAQPDFLGLLEPMPEIGRLAHAAGALFVAVIEPVSLAVLEPPGAYGADIVPARASRWASRRSTAARTSGSSPAPTPWSARSPGASSA